MTAGAAGSSPGAGQPASSKAVKGRRRAAGGGGTAALQEQEPVQTVRVTAGGRRPREAAEPASGADASGAAAAEKPKAPAGAAAKKARSGSAASAGPTRALEEALWAKSFRHVAGVDEAGRGPLAGPVVTAACVLPPGVQLEGVDDSKAMTEEQRERAYELLTSHPGVAWSTCIVGPAEIDERNILQATLHGMREAVKKLPADRLSYVLVDGNKLPAELPVPAQAVVRGDAKCLNIAAASIIAKVTRCACHRRCRRKRCAWGHHCALLALCPHDPRNHAHAYTHRDRIMVEYDKLYPQYGFAQHKGYPTPGHFAAVRKHGPCPIYRRSFEPIRSMTGWSRQPKPSGS